MNGAVWDQLLRSLRLLDDAAFPVALGAVFSSVVDDAKMSAKAASHCVLEAGRRLRLSNDEIHQAEWLARFHHSLDEAPDLTLAELKRALAEPLAEDLLHILEARL